MSPVEIIPKDLQTKYFKQTSYIYHTVDLEDEFIKKRFHPINKFIDFEYIHTILPTGAVIAGGYVLSAMRNKPAIVNDIDIYSLNEDMFLELSSNLENAGYTKKVSTNSHKYVFADTWEKARRLPVQLVRTMWFESPEHVIDTFDFTACQFALQNGFLIYNPLSVFDVTTNKLILHRINFPGSILKRVTKYEKKGFKIDSNTKSIIEKAMSSSNTDDIINSLY